MVLTTTPEQLDEWLRHPEGTRLEFKSAHGGFNSKYDLPDYTAALANEGGGKLILGVDDDSHTVVGTSAFIGTYHELSHELFQSIDHRVEVEEVLHPDGRVVVFHVPNRPKGRPVRSNGHFTYPMRLGESLTEMDSETLRGILAEISEDFTAQPVPGLSIEDLDEAAIELLKQRRAAKLKRPDLVDSSTEQLLRDLELLSVDGLTRAALILLGRSTVLTRHLPDDEVIFEWRQTVGKVPHDYRETWRGPILLVHDQIWAAISARNARTPYQEGFIEHEILAFDERSIREAVLNAITHRDYSLGGQSIFIRATPESILVESPGGFLPGVTPENALAQSQWRNRRLAETLERLDLVNRSGQGLDDIFTKTISDGKGIPDLTKSDTRHVRLVVPTRVLDVGFVRYLERVAKEKKLLFSTTDLLELERIRTEQTVGNLHSRDKFLTAGIIERIGRGRGTKYILSYSYYESQHRAGVHTRLVGLTRDEKKALILKHLAKKPAGMTDFIDALPDLKRESISKILQELKRAGKIEHRGSRKAGLWQLL